MARRKTTKQPQDAVAKAQEATPLNDSKEVQTSNPADTATPEDIAQMQNSDAAHTAQETETTSPEETPDAAENGISATHSSEGKKTDQDTTDDIAEASQEMSATEGSAQSVSGSVSSSEETPAASAEDDIAKTLLDDVNAETPQEAQQDTDATEQKDAIAAPWSTPADDNASAVEAPEPTPPTPVPAKSSSSFMPALFGGLTAAVIGYAGANFIQPNGWPFPGGKTEQVDALTAEVSVLSDELNERDQDIAALRVTIEELQTELQETASNSAFQSSLDRQAEITTELTALRDALESQAAATIETARSEIDQIETNLAEQANALLERLTTLERRPVEETVSADVIASYENELTRLQEAMVAQRGEIDGFIASAQSDFAAKIEEQRAEVTQMLTEAKAAEVAAEISAADSEKQALALRIKSAIEIGSPFAQELASLIALGSDVAIEQLGALAESGVPTAQSLISAVPETARAALLQMRSAGINTGGEGTKLGGFIAAQIGLRSVTPQEGDAPDAVLSRIEAAARAENWMAALEEITALPETGQLALANWSKQVKSRLAALAEAEALVQSTQR